MKYKSRLWNMALWLCCYILSISYSYSQESSTGKFLYGDDFYFLEEGFAEEQSVATDFLISKGMDKGKCALKVIAVNSELVIMEDRKNRLFVIEARRDRHCLMPQPILAYSMENTLRGNPIAIAALLSTYTAQLRDSYETNIYARLAELIPYKSRYNVIVPMLGATKWGQGAPYNLFCRNIYEESGANLAGCLSVAVAQVMRYYRYPQQGAGQAKYRSIQKQTYIQDMSQCFFDWDSVKDTYSWQEKDTAVTYPIARIISGVAMSLHANFGKEGTSAQLVNAKMALSRHLRYSPDCSLVSSAKPMTMLSIVYQELDEKRPVVLCGGSHAFVCDGRDGEFLHFNMGWNGESDGYYRMIVYPGARGLFFSDMLTGIKPDEYFGFEKDVNVKTPGTLNYLLTPEEQLHLHKLTITGRINAEDMALIRRMAGAAGQGDGVGWTGSLTHLDLCQARFKSDAKEPYVRINSKGFNSFVVTPRDYNVNKNGVYFLTKEGNDYWMNYTMKDKVIGDFMFYGCVNLQEIILPDNTQEIRGYAFSNCNSITRIDLPAKVAKIVSRAFNWMPSLEMVTYINAISPENIGECLFEHSDIAAKRLIIRKE
ncbi:MAG: C10 family peptidase [Bacteroides sp.]|nr:C10 family peptidase [Roseburia sp.]MCM1347583.1 C10 family peptidase [Bacteroides sp.]MCM1422044.1 C10 family peptidase [Bacteroides sp.]